MTQLNIKRSKVPGVKPTKNQFPDSNTVIWNEADGRLWGLSVTQAGRVVVLIGGGVNNIGAVHAQIHALDSVEDHSVPDPANWGKYLYIDELTGQIKFKGGFSASAQEIFGYSGHLTLPTGTTAEDLMINFFIREGTDIIPYYISYKIRDDGVIEWSSDVEITNGIALIK